MLTNHAAHQAVAAKLWPAGMAYLAAMKLMQGAASALIRQA
jgi:hypothetical protein